MTMPNRLHGKAEPFFIRAKRACPRCGRPIDHLMIAKVDGKYVVTCPLCKQNVAQRRNCPGCKRKAIELKTRKLRDQVLLSCKECNHVVDRIESRAN